MNLEKITNIYNEKKERLGSDIAGHLPFLYQITKATKPEVIIQAGIRDGNSDSAFAKAALELGATLVDIDMNDVQDGVIKDIRQQEDNWHFHLGRTDKQEIVDAVQQYRGKVGIFFTDTSHNYSDTKFELDTYSKLLSPEGIILIHDMDPWNQYPEQTRAVEDFLEKNTKWKYKVQKGNNGMATLYRLKKHLCNVKCDVDLGIGTHTVA